jgi:predicted nucleic acid-binding protein
MIFVLDTNVLSEGAKHGLSVDVRDSMIAATAAVRGWTVATRNTSDFATLGVSVFNPWTDKLPAH